MLTAPTLPVYVGNRVIRQTQQTHSIKMWETEVHENHGFIEILKFC